MSPTCGDSRANKISILNQLLLPTFETVKSSDESHKSVIPASLTLLFYDFLESLGVRRFWQPKMDNDFHLSSGAEPKPARLKKLEYFDWNLLK